MWWVGCSLHLRLYMHVLNWGILDSRGFKVPFWRDQGAEPSFWALRDQRSWTSKAPGCCFLQSIQGGTLCLGTSVSPACSGSYSSTDVRGPCCNLLPLGYCMKKFVMLPPGRCCVWSVYFLEQNFLKSGYEDVGWEPEHPHTDVKRQPLPWRICSTNRQVTDSVNVIIHVLQMGELKHGLIYS